MNILVLFPVLVLVIVLVLLHALTGLAGDRTVFAMGGPRARRAPVKSATARRGLTITVAAGVLAFAPSARADRNDLRLLNLCEVSGDGTCAWVNQGGGMTMVTVDADPEATSRYRSLMSELGVVMAPRLQTPADTLGFAGFQISAELGTTQISRDKPFWNGVEAVNPANTRARPDALLTTVGVFARKGMWYPFPALEWGVGAMNLLQSGLWAVQGYVKLALLEGFHDWPLPSAAVRGGFSQLVGTDQVTLTIGSVDVLVSKAFSLVGTARVEPFAGWNLLLMDARSGVIDATPGCDAVALEQAKDPAAVARLPAACPLSQAGTPGDLGANFVFPQQDLITRQRLYAGAKVRLASLFVVGQAAVAPRGKSIGPKSALGIAARDESGSQTSVSLSLGMDF